MLEASEQCKATDQGRRCRRFAEHVKSTGPDYDRVHDCGYSFRRMELVDRVETPSTLKLCAPEKPCCARRGSIFVDATDCRCACHD